MRSVSTWFYITAALLLCAVLALAGCSVDAKPAVSPVVKVITGTGHGSGVSIGNGIILTAQHVVGDSEAVKLKTETGELIDAEVLWASKKYDIAYVRAKTTEGIGSANLVCREPGLGEEITIRGNPSDQEFITVWGRVAGHSREVFRWADVAVANIATIPGQSGGPVFDADGNLVGIVVGVMGTRVGFGASLVSVGYFVPADTVCGLIARA